MRDPLAITTWEGRQRLLGFLLGCRDHRASWPRMRAKLTMTDYPAEQVRADRFALLTEGLIQRCGRTQLTITDSGRHFIQQQTLKTPA